VRLWRLVPSPRTRPPPVSDEDDVDKDVVFVVSMEGMKRVLSMLGLLVFVGGILVLPAAHRLTLSGKHVCSHTAEHPSPGHDDDHRNDRSDHDPSECPICRLVQTPVDAVAPTETGPGRTLVNECVALPHLPAAATAVVRANGPRAPPFSA
jgi:hypothetical protein